MGMQNEMFFKNGYKHWFQKCKLKLRQKY